jgi:hypothetical protein
MSVTAQMATQYTQGQIGHFVNTSDDEVIIIKPPFIVNVFDPGPRAFARDAALRERSLAIR